MRVRWSSSCICGCVSRSVLQVDPLRYHRSEVVDPVAASSQLHILFPYFLYNHDCEVFYGVSRKVLMWAATGFSIFLVLMSDLVAIVADVQGVLCLTHVLLTTLLAGGTELCTPCTTGRSALERVCGPDVLACLTTPDVA